MKYGVISIWMTSCLRASCISQLSDVSSEKYVAVCGVVQLHRLSEPNIEYKFVSLLMTDACDVVTNVRHVYNKRKCL